jgi:hypothetical protein
MGVTVDRGAVGDFVGLGLGDGRRAVPANEITFDGIAVGMSADRAAAGVTGEVGRKVGCDHVVYDVSLCEKEAKPGTGERVCFEAAGMAKGG